MSTAVSSLDIFLILALVILAVLSAVWWLRHSRRGLDWILAAVPLAFGLSYLSSFLFRVPDYQSGCTALCPGWWGYPIATHLISAIGRPTFHPSGFALNSGVYYALLLVASTIVGWLAAYLRWPERRWRWRLGFILVIIIAPLALTPSWLPPPGPRLPMADQRLAINAERAWRWQLQARRLTDRRLAVEDVHLHPDGERRRVCFRAYTWFYLPYRHIYIDLEPAGVRAAGGGAIPLDASCWVQP